MQNFFHLKSYTLNGKTVWYISTKLYVNKVVIKNNKIKYLLSVQYLTAVFYLLKCFIHVKKF